MARKKFEKGTEEYQLFADFYQFCQLYAIPEQSDEWWDECKEAGNKLCEKYYNSQFARDLVGSQICKLGRMAKE